MSGREVELERPRGGKGGIYREKEDDTRVNVYLVLRVRRNRRTVDRQKGDMTK